MALSDTDISEAFQKVIGAYIQKAWDEETARSNAIFQEYFGRTISRVDPEDGGFDDDGSEENKEYE